MRLAKGGPGYACDHSFHEEKKITHCQKINWHVRQNQEDALGQTTQLENLSNRENDANEIKTMTGET